MCKRLVFAILSCFVLSLQTIVAQSDSICLSGRVIDAISEVPIENADVVLVKPDSTIVSRGKTIDWCKKYGVTDGPVLITYNILVPNPGRYIIRVTAQNYECQSVNIEIPEKQYGKRPTDWEVADIALEKDFLLDEVIVQTSKVLLVNKGDTVEYNASAFQLAEGSMLDALISQLPGVRLTENGQIFVNEQYVSSLLVNGQDFFKGNPMVALKNLPAYTVNKVKAYHREDKSDYLIKRDSIEHLGDELVLDVALKKEYHESWLANAELGYGSDNRYVGRLFGMRLSDKQRLTAFANLNNIGEMRQPGENVESSAEFIPQQPITEYSGGMDYFIDLGKKRTYSTVLTAVHHNEDAQTEVASNSTAADLLTYSRSRTTTESHSTEVSWRNLLGLPFKKLYSEFTFGAEYGKTHHNGMSQNAELNRLPYEAQRLAALDSVFAENASMNLMQTLINRYAESTREKTERRHLVASGQAKWKDPLLGNPMSLYAEVNYEHGEMDGVSQYTLRSYPVPVYLNRVRNDVSGQHDLNAMAQVQYEYRLPRNLKLFASYKVSTEHTSSDRSIDTISVVPESEIIPLLAADMNNSYERTFHRFTHLPQLQLHYLSPRWLMSLHMPVKIANVKYSEHRRSGDASQPERHYVAFEPILNINGNNGLAATCSYRAEEPLMQYLTGLQDNHDPLHIMVAGTDLKNKGIYTATLNYSKTKSSKVRTIGIAGIFTATQNDVTLQRLYDQYTGVTTYLPKNVNGNNTISFRGSFSQAIDNAKHFFPEIITQLNLAQTVGYSGYSSDGVSLRVAMKTLNLAQQLGVKYQSGSIALRLFSRGEWLHGVSSLDTYSNINIRRFRYAFTAVTPLVWDIQLSADCSLYTIHGYEDASMNTKSFVLNATLSRSFLRSKALTVKVTGFDLLNNCRNIQQSFNAYGRVETWRNVMHRYAMLHLIYRFNKLPKKQE